MRAILINIVFLAAAAPALFMSWSGPVTSSAFFPAQFIDSPIVSPPDTLPFPFNDQGNTPGTNEGYESGMYLHKPLNISSVTEYDPESNEYVIREKMGNLNYRYPLTLSFDEYVQYDFNKSVKDYWRQRYRSESFDHQSSLVPQLHINNEVFETVFGSNTIDIKPQGSAELIFGVNINRIDNPALPEKLRRTTTFDFQEKIQMNVTGQIGDKLKLATSYNTEASFEFENKMNLAYEGKEDEIIRKIEAGDVSLPLTGSLINGSYSLFGIKTELQFGKLTVTNIFSQQKGKSSVIEVQGGAQVSQFEVYSDQYEANRHFFLGQFFYDNYNTFLQNLPIISSGINITKIEVWVTNKTANFTEARNIVAFTDLGEGAANISNPQVVPNPLYPYTSLPADTINSLSFIEFLYPGVRDISTVSTALPQAIFTAGKDYEKIESARLLNPSEYTINTNLGYISLNTALNSDEVLGVAFEYTYGGKAFRVGEFSNSGVASPNALIIKLIKGTALTPQHPVWTLMMKNIYSIGAYQVNTEDFKLDVMYQNDKTGAAIAFLPVGAIDGKPLLEILNLDNLNSQLDPYPDGVFDFIDKITINPSNGRIIFPVTEPFGEYLYQQIIVPNPADSTIAQPYIYFELYDSTQSKARQIAEKNKFFLKGTYKSSSGSEIPLNAMNIPQGSVKVTAGGQILTENQDYTVDYTLGRVKIINQGLLESGTPIKISLESNSLFNIQSKTLLGMHLNYQFNKEFNLGATILNLTERPLTQKVNIGDEPISNTIWGIDGTYRTQSRLLTKIVDKIPFLETKEASSITINGEFAHLIPGHSRAIEKNGISYIDDFEGSKSSIDLRSVSAWVLASTPQGQGGLFPEGNLSNDLANGFNRAKFSWFVIDPLFLRNNSATPEHIKDSPEQQNHFVREIFEKELFPNRENPNGVPTNIPVLNLSYYPNERGQYNFDTLNVDTSGFLLYPSSRWGGIMRKIESNDFEAANIEFIEFWLMDPFVYDSSHVGGQLFFNLGNISEDVLRDGRKSFENGLPTGAGSNLVDTTIWGIVPIIQSVVSAFDNNPDSRPYQDVGLDGMSNASEVYFFSSQNSNQSYRYLDALYTRFGPTSNAYLKALADPSSDDYHYFRGTDYDSEQRSILDRYRLYNGMEGNSPASEQSTEDYSTSSTTQPNAEDINRDNTLSELESYFQYRIELRPERMHVGDNFITDEVIGTNKDGDPVTWYQFKIPVYDPDTTIGGISDFKSIRFFRMFMRGFEEPVFLRFARLDLVRGEWRKYNAEFLEGGPFLPGELAETSFDVSAVNIEENGAKSPVNYVLPPGVSRVIDPTNPQLRQLNEQALVMKVCALSDGDARAAYRNVDLDVRQYKRLQMFVHAEAINTSSLSLKDNDLCIFIRLGSDYQNNYYEYEIPLILTPGGSYNNDDESQRLIVWPEANTFNFEFDILQKTKQLRNNEMRQSGSSVTLNTVYSIYDGKNRISVIGNPNLSNIRTIMIGVRNRTKTGNVLPDDGLPKCVEVWVNELRLTDFDERGGWAANARITTKLADFGTVTIAGSTSKPGFGSIEKKVNERSKEEVLQYDISSNFEMGKFFPERVKLSIPLFIGYSEGIKNPQYNPLDPDIPLKLSLQELDNKEERDSLKRIAQDYTRRKSLNFTNVKLNKVSGNPMPWDISNFAVSYSFNEQYARNISTEFNTQKQYRGALTYNFNTTPKNVTPLSNSKFFDKPLLKLIKDFNFYYLPQQFSFMTDINRQYTEIQLRNIDNPNYRLPPTFTKDFLWNRIYDMKFDITKSLKFDFSANNTARIDEPVTYGQRVDKDYTTEYAHWKDSVWTGIQEFGRTTNYRHTFNVNYTLPINKIPIFNWLTANARYGGTYEWNTSPRLADASINLGNTIKNGNTQQINTQANLITLYNKVPFLQRVNQKYSKAKKPGKKKTEKEQVFFPKKGDPPALYNFKTSIPKSINHKLGTIDIVVKVFDSTGVEITPVVKIVNENRIVITTDKDVPRGRVEISGNREKADNIFIMVLEQSARVLMCVRNVSVSYTENNGTVLPGYLPETQFLGMEQFGGQWSPGFGFITGKQDRDFGLNASNDYDWVTKDSLLNSAFLMNHTENLNIRATIEPVRGMRIDVTANRSTSENITEYYRYETGDARFNAFGTMVTGNFSMTYNTWKTNWEVIGKDGDYTSKAFDNFKNYRITIAKRLASKRRDSDMSGLNGYDGTIDPTTGFPDGYGSTSQEVVIPAFLAAYSGKSPELVSLNPFPGIASISPNWSLTYNGLTNLGFVKKIFKTLTISHAYRSSYSVNSYTTNLDFMAEGEDGFSWARYTLGNFIPEKEINAISISEQFSPMINIDGTLNNSLITKFEFKRSRNLSFSFSNNQLTETRSSELVLGTGYRLKDLKFQINSKEFKSDLNIRGDVSIRDDFTVIRKLEEATGGYDQLTAGQKMVSIKFSADYMLGDRFNLRLFYDRTVRKPKTSISFDTYNTSIGVSVRFTLAQ